LFLTFTAVSVAFFAVRFWTVLAAGELFHRLGFDWTLFYAQSMALRAGAGPGIYDQAVIDRYLQPLLAYYAGPAGSLDGWPQPYPPFFAAVAAPLTLPPAPVAFGLWLALSLAAVGFLAWRVSQFLPDLGVVGAALAILASIPVAWGLFMGQPMVLLAVSVSEMFISLRSRHEWRAGFWLATLLLKPQYALLFGLLILWKRRWRAVGGAVLGGLGLLLLGAVTAGPQSYLGFLTSVREMSDLHGGIAGASLMMNWRAVVLAVRPSIGEVLGQSIVWALILGTMVVSLLPFRGAWDPRSTRFAPAFCILTLGALVSSYHSHPHGAALLILPLAAAWAAPVFGSVTRTATWVAVYAPTFIVIWVAVVVQGMAISSDSDVPIWTVWPNVLPAVLFILSLGLMSVDMWTYQRANRA
jgi:hypothetical protein